VSAFFTISLIFIIAVVFLLYSYFIETRMIHVNRSRIRTSRLKGRYTILHFSDLHLYKKMRKKNLDKIKEELKLWTDWAKFDFIFMTGDFIDNNSGIEMLREVVGGMKSRYGTYAVLGNHDYYQYNILHLLNPLFCFWDKKPADLKALKKAIENAGVHLLIDQEEKVTTASDELLITGIDYKFMEEKRAPGLNIDSENIFNIVLSHYPDMVKYYNGKADIMLSGHTHGGQITFFGLPLIIKSGIKKIYSKGISAHGNTALFVSKGLGVSRNFPFRFFARPDFNIIEIIGVKNG